MAYTQEYIETHRDAINTKKRQKYSSERRRAEYYRTRGAILKKGREDRANCPLCGLDFRRLYIPRHIATRHKKQTAQNLTDDLSVHLYGSE
jgi:hypothetical protein